MSYVLSNLPGDIQDVLDWWVGPIGFMLPAEDQWDNYIATSAILAAGGYILNSAEITRTFVRMAEHRITQVYLANPGKIYPKAALRTAASRQVVKGTVLRGMALLTRVVPTPLSLLFWTVTIATSIPPDGSSPYMHGYKTAGAVYNAQGQIVDYTM